jgi:hypothetical protein
MSLRNTQKRNRTSQPRTSQPRTSQRRIPTERIPKERIRVGTEVLIYSDPDEFGHDPNGRVASGHMSLSVGVVISLHEHFAKVHVQGEVIDWAVPYHNLYYPI